MKDRPGHDRRYRDRCGEDPWRVGLRPAIAFEQGLAATVAWYRAHEPWWRRVMSGEYLKYYEKNYASKMCQ